MEKETVKNLEELKEAMKIPAGGVDFVYESSAIFDKNKKGFVIFEVVSGLHYFRLVRDDDLQVHFFHSSHGTGTRVASVDLSEHELAQLAIFSFQWSPDNVSLWVVPGIPGTKGEFIKSDGRPSDMQYKVGLDGNVYAYSNNEFLKIDLFKSGKPILIPTAYEAWKNTINAIELLDSAALKKTYEFEIVSTNLILSMLVTGFEVYTKRRFTELEQEGVAPDMDGIIKSFYSKKERDNGIKSILSEEAREEKETLNKFIVSKGVINFQNFDKCKLAYNKGYSLKFGDLEISQETIVKVQTYIKLRHQIIHVSPYLHVLNQARVHKEDPIFANKQTALDAIKHFKEFIHALHNQTLSFKLESNGIKKVFNPE